MNIQEKTCQTCYWLERRTCSLNNIVPMSKDGKGKRECSSWTAAKTIQALAQEVRK